MIRAYAEGDQTAVLRLLKDVLGEYGSARTSLR
jgi:hypothetical protein